MKRIALAVLVAAFAIGSALAQETCESKAVGKDGKPLSGAAKTSFIAKCKRDACSAKAMSVCMFASLAQLEQNRDSFSSSQESAGVISKA